MLGSVKQLYEKCAVFTIGGTPLSFGHDSIYGGSVNRGIFDNYPLTHLLDLDHDSWWVAEIKKREISGLITRTPGGSHSALSAPLPAPKENVIGPDHGQRQQPVQTVAGNSRLHRGESLHISQDELSPSKPLFVSLTVAPESVDPLGQLRVLGQVF